MVKIHWTVYLIIGIAILFTSYKIDSQKFKLFIWLAYLFIAIGTAKLVFGYINKKRESPKEKKEIRGNIYQRATQKRATRYCPNCGNVLNRYENFCPMCGTRLK